MCDKLSHRSAITLLDANKADTYSRPLHCYACCKSFKIILMSRWLVIAWMVSQPTVSSRISSTEWQKIFLNFFVSPHPPALLDHLLPCNSPHPLSTTRRSTAFSHPARHLWNLVPQVVSKYWLSLSTFKSCLKTHLFKLVYSVWLWLDWLHSQWVLCYGFYNKSFY